MISITVDGVAMDVPSSAADVNWAADQVAFEQALVDYVDSVQEQVDEGVSGAAGTAGSGTGISGALTYGNRSVVHTITVDSTALNVADTEANVTLWTLPAKTRITRVIADVTTEFTGGAISAVTLTVGRAAGDDEFLLIGNVFAAPITLGNTQAELGAGVLGGGSFASDITWGATQAVVAQFLSTTANLNALTAGSVTFYIECCTYP
jgi:hypothetical protein